MAHRQRPLKQFLQLSLGNVLMALALLLLRGCDQEQRKALIGEGPDPEKEVDPGEWEDDISYVSGVEEFRWAVWCTDK